MSKARFLPAPAISHWGSKPERSTEPCIEVCRSDSRSTSSPLSLIRSLRSASSRVSVSISTS